MIRKTDVRSRFITGDGTYFKAICSMRVSYNGRNIMLHRKKPSDYGTGIPYHEAEALSEELFPFCFVYTVINNIKGGF